MTRAHTLRRLAAGALLAAMPLPPAAAPAATKTPEPIELAVDATDAPRGVFHSHLVIPAGPGPLTLAYPKWVQGEHTPTGPVMQVAGLTIAAAGRALPWRRDPLDMFLVRVEVPAGASSIEVSFDYLSPATDFGAGYGETPNATPHLLIVDWHDLVMVPLGPRADAVTVHATLRLPRGWQHDSALAATERPEGALAFAPASLYTLIDSPVLAGDLFQTIEVGPAERISLAADRRASLAVPQPRIEAYRRLVREAQALFGGKHYRTYHWLVALSDALDHNGLEHHESSDDRGSIGTFTGESDLIRAATLLSHEYVHSWNGKYRRPAGLAVPDLEAPLRTELLWVYEGLTRYLGDLVLAGRSGIWTPEESRDFIAYVAAGQDRNRPGRRWRPLADTAVSVQILGGLAADWTAYRRSLDYYDESLLIWLEADMILRERSGGTKSLDDFCRAFFGGNEPPAVVPYTADDLYTALGRIVAYDWRGFFAARVEAVTPRAPLGGLAASGWKLVYDDRPNVIQQARAKSQKLQDASLSLGLWIKDDGTVSDVVLESPAWTAGLGPGMKISAVNGRAWSTEAFQEELTAAAQSSAPFVLTALHGEELRTFRIAGPVGPRWPHLVRDPSRPDRLQDVLAPRTPIAGAGK